MKLLLKFLGFLFLLSIVFYSYARLVEPALLTVKYENIYSSYIDDNIKIVQFSDTHISGYFDANHLKKVADKINAQNRMWLFLAAI